MKLPLNSKSPLKQRQIYKIRWPSKEIIPVNFRTIHPKSSLFQSEFLFNRSVFLFHKFNALIYQLKCMIAYLNLIRAFPRIKIRYNQQDFKYKKNKPHKGIQKFNACE